VLAARTLAGPTDAAAFLSPSLLQLHEPSLIPDMDRAAERVLGALERGEQVVIYGDYDVDGVSGAAILYHVMRAIRPGADVRTYVPHRLEEGYGINSEALAQIAAGGARLVVSVDCGVTAIEPAREARRLGLDLIITDHHNPPARAEDLPNAHAVVHPRRPDSQYPFDHLCGAGVAYKLAWRLATMHAGGPRVAAPMRVLLLDLLPLAALGVIADVVPLTGENRVIAKFGLGRIKQSGGARSDCLRGLHALVAASRLDSDRVDSYDAGFKLAPRLNAAGRMGHAREAVELFTTADAARSEELAAKLTEQNNQRRSVEGRIFEQACRMAEEAGMTGPDRRAIVLAHEEWHAGVVGIVCSRLIDRFCRPTILLQRRPAEQLCHGSGRSIEGFNLHDALRSCSAHLAKFGGHDMAAGLTLPEAGLAAFTEAFVEAANAALGADDLVPLVTVDCEASLRELTVAAVEELRRLEPFGRGNPPVQVVVRGVTPASPPQFIGAHGKHLSFTIRDGRGGGRHTLMRLVGWNWGQWLEHIRPGEGMDVVIEPRVSGFNGRMSVEPRLVDLSPRPPVEVAGAQAVSPAAAEQP
jgi:single-stranded-DNA-specific exonuclease